MTTRNLVYALLLVLAFGAGALCKGGLYAPAMAQDDTADKPVEGETPAAVTTSIIPRIPVVAAIPLVTETSYEMDPFNVDHIRSTKSEVKRVLVVRADGSQEIRPATDKL